MQPSVDIATGRFAPTPSGPLHFGSLLTAVASYCQVKSMNGRWLLRIEDIDTPRVIPGAADDIIHTLEAFGFEWQGEVLFQSHRFDIYEEYLQGLIAQGLVYGCSCSRKFLLKSPHKSGPLGLIYPGHCRHKKLNYDSISLRLTIESPATINFNDGFYGHQQIDLHNEIGDIVLKRLDGIYAYHLAVVIDDSLQGINQIVRGSDLLRVSFIHLHLNKLLAFKDAQYLHIPLIKNSSGKKLSKQTGARAIQISNAAELLIRCLKILGQKTPAELVYSKPAEILQYACKHWNSANIGQADKYMYSA